MVIVYISYYFIYISNIIISNIYLKDSFFQLLKMWVPFKGKFAKYFGCSEYTWSKANAASYGVRRGLSNAKPQSIDNLKFNIRKKI